MDRRVIDLESAFVAAPADVLGCFLHRVIARDIDAVDIHLGGAVGHHVDQYFRDARGVFDPDGFGVP